MCISLLGHLAQLYATFAFGDILGEIFMNQNLALWMILKDTIGEETSTTNEEFLQRVYSNFSDRLVS